MLPPQFVTAVCRRSVLCEGPVPSRRRGRARRRFDGTIAEMSAPAGLPPRIEIPRWIQLVVLPLLLVLVWILVTTAAHVVVLFIVAGLIALLLDPLVRTLGRLGARRGLA